MPPLWYSGRIDKPKQDAWEARSPAPRAPAVLPAARAKTQATSKPSKELQTEENNAQRLTTLSSSPTQTHDNEDDHLITQRVPQRAPHHILTTQHSTTLDTALRTHSHTFANVTPPKPQKVSSPHLDFQPLCPHLLFGPTNCHAHNPKRTTTKQNARSHNMPITDLIHLQSKRMSAGYLTYLSLLPPGTKAIDTAHNTYLKTIGLQSNALVVTYSKLPPRSATHSLVRWSDYTGAFHLVGAHTGSSIQAEALVSFPSMTFAAFAISIAPKNTVPLFCTWTDATLLPDDFTSTANPTSQAGMPQFLLIPLLWLTTWDIPVDHPIDTSLPYGSTTMASPPGLPLCASLPPRTRHPASTSSILCLTPPTGPILVPATQSFPNPRPGPQSVAQPASPSSTTPDLPAFVPSVPEAPQPHTGATTADTHDLIHAFVTAHA
eukprot:jgi/Psemu1/57615/gm1.57615_g